MNRPPSGFNRPGSRNTSYGGNQAGPQAAQGTSVNTNVEVTARPAVMREGMKGMNVASRAGVPGTSAGFGPGRQVIDRSYHIGILRPKIAELTAEIERLKHQEEQINKNSAMLGQLQQRHRALAEEIQTQKGIMADVNFAVEKANVQDAESLQAQALQMRQANAESRRQVDKLFLGVKEVDAQTRANTQALEQELRVLEQRIIQEGQDFNTYKATRDEAFSVSDAVLQQMHELRSLAARQELLMQSLAQDPDKKRGSSFLLDIIKKRRERDEMTKECSLSVDQEKQQLIKQAKSTRDDIEVLERQVNEARDTLLESKNQLQSVNADLREYSSDNSSAFQELQEKDREMQEFMETFPVKEKEELAKIQQVEQQITEVLERISRAHLLKQQMPQDNTPKMLEQLSAELGEKETQLRNATVTHQRLEKELAERKEELAKVAHLDEKITAELQQHAQKMAEQKQDIIRYSDIDALRQEIDSRRKSLSGRKQYLLRQRDCSKLQIHLLTNQFEGKKQKLNADDVHTALAAQEQKLRLIWQSAFALEDFVRMKEKETQYMTVKADCMRMTDECNNILRDPKRFDQQPGTVNFVVGK
jgi:intraflagellar transport protein 74